MCKLTKWAASAAVLVAAAATQASAAVMVATFTGTVDRGYDTLGAFGPPGSPIGPFQPGGNLAGDSYTATYTYDTQIGRLVTQPTFLDLNGSLYSTPPRASPILDAKLTINGNSYHFPANGVGAIVLYNDGSGSYVSGFAQSAYGPSQYTDMTISPNGGAVPLNLEQPFNISYPAAPGGAGGYARNLDTTSLAYRFEMDLNVSTLNVSPLNASSGNSPATKTDLAMMSADVYNPTLSSSLAGTGFVLLQDIAGSNGLRVGVYGNDPTNPTDVVLSFRGTDWKDPNIAKNIFADATLSTGVSDPTMTEYLAEGDAVLQQEQSIYRNATISLTGHSLGGTIAQVLGAAAGYRAEVFDAPGGGEVLAQNILSLHDLAGLGAGGSIIDYRMNGDQFGLVGTQLGNVITLGNAPPLASAFDLAQILAIHDPNLIAQYIADPNAILGAGVLGPVPFKFLNGVLVQGTPLGTNASAITQVISAAATYFFDPTQFALYSLEADPGSPFYQSLLLPSLQGVDHYLLSYRANGVWSSFFALDPLSQYDFAQGIDGIRFEAIDSGGDPFYIPNAFYFSMTFASDGVFSGQLSGLSIGVPEPATWSLLLVGFGSLGVFIRGRRRPAVPPDTKQISTSYMERQTAGRPQRRLH